MKNWFVSRGMVMISVIGLILVVGCGGPKKSVETGPREVAPPTDASTQKPVTPESPNSDSTTDYTTMQPSEMGIKDVYFAYDNHELDDASMRILSQNARILKDHVDVVVMIEGHCDERGTFEYNLALGEKRAKGVRDYLVSLGVGVGQLRITSYGESKPMATGSNEAAWAQNRRAHFGRP